MKLLILFSIFLLISLIISGTSGDIPQSSPEDPIYIGVLLPLTGTEGHPLYEALQYGVDQINRGGGIGGRPVQVIFRDTNNGNFLTYAKELVQDPRIPVVIGPYTSDELFKISDLFIRNQKVLVSPSASSDEIFRAFSGTGNVWRLTTNDRDITSVIMQHINNHNGKSVAILSPNNSYGMTFYDWIPFWAIDTGINLTGNLQYTSSDEIPVDLSELATANPDYIIFLTSGSNKDISSALKTLSTIHSSSHLYLIQPNINENGNVVEKSDTTTVLHKLISGQWQFSNMSSTSISLPDDTLLLLSPPQDSDFAEAYATYSGAKPSSYVSEVYDSLLVSAEIMARFTIHSNQSPMKAANSVLGNGTGKLTPRTELGIQSAFEMIQHDEIPIMTGATGPLTFVPEGTDRENPQYQTYQIRDGIVTEDPISYQVIDKNQISPGYFSDIEENESHPDNKPPAKDFWAVIGGLSQDWSNYRHQADALTVYQLLKWNGVPDDHIILLIYDDIPYDPRNVKPGEVFHIPDIQEVRTTATLDYSGSQVNKEDIERVLTGSGQEQNLPVLGSDQNSTVLVYLASHGSDGGNLIIDDGKDMITPEEFSSIVDKMKTNKKFGKMLIVLESCFSGALADQVTTPGVLLMTASGKNETSKSTTYDSALSLWISDEFTNQLSMVINQSDEQLSIGKLYEKIYGAVRSSHPGIYNYNNSFPLSTPAGEFFGFLYSDLDQKRPELFNST